MSGQNYIWLHIITWLKDNYIKDCKSKQSDCISGVFYHWCCCLLLSFRITLCVSENSDILRKQWKTHESSLGTAPLIALSVRPVEESFHAKPLANRCQWHSVTLTQASIVQLLKGFKRPNSSYSRTCSKCNFRLHQLHSTKKTFVGATSPWFANGTICIYLLLHLVTFLRHRLNDQQPQHDKDVSNNQCSCSQLKPLQPQQSFSISPSLQFQNTTVIIFNKLLSALLTVQKYLGTMEPSSFSQGCDCWKGVNFVAQSPSRLCCPLRFPNRWCIGMGLSMYIYRCI